MNRDSGIESIHKFDLFSMNWCMYRNQFVLLVLRFISRIVKEYFYYVGQKSTKMSQSDFQKLNFTKMWHVNRYLVEKWLNRELINNSLRIASTPAVIHTCKYLPNSFLQSSKIEASKIHSSNLECAIMETGLKKAHVYQMTRLNIWPPVEPDSFWIKLKGLAVFDSFKSVPNSGHFSKVRNSRFPIKRKCETTCRIPLFSSIGRIMRHPLLSFFLFFLHKILLDDEDRISSVIVVSRVCSYDGCIIEKRSQLFSRVCGNTKNRLWNWILFSIRKCVFLVSISLNCVKLDKFYRLLLLLFSNSI